MVGLGPKTGVRNFGNPAAKICMIYVHTAEQDIFSARVIVVEPSRNHSEQSECFFCVCCCRESEKKVAVTEHGPKGNNVLPI